MDTDVIVVGAGPAGLMLAGELRLGGADVVVLERLATPTDESRASTLHARTMELFDQRGLLERFGTPNRETLGHFGGISLELGGVDSAHSGIWKVAQATVERVLADWASDAGAKIRRTHDVVDVEAGQVDAGNSDTQDGDTRGSVRVRARTPDGAVELRARYVVGCDGEHSTVRGVTQLPFPGRAASRRLLRADVRGIDIPNRRFERLPGGLAIASRRPDGVTRVMMAPFETPAPLADDTPSFAEICETWQKLTGEDLRAATPLWCNAFSDESRQVSRYRKGRVLVAGDAAHRQLPIGGQAINLALADAVNLGWKLAGVATGRWHDALLDSYDDERRAAGARARMLVETQAALLLGGAEVDPVRHMLSDLLAHPPVRDALAAAVAGVDVRYATRWTHPLAGLRLPDVAIGVRPVDESGTCRPNADVTTTYPHDLLRPGRPILLNLDCDAAWHEISHSKAAAAGLTLVCAEQPPARSLDTVKALLVRPDGHVDFSSDVRAESLQALAAWQAWRRGSAAALAR